mmetsp:Transcript_56967/g.90776  ORF Transcript_56967/g.90776 Transcript_56967/m.90776 type:complete len:211 (-) Transcript_56967:805-1437(-)
MNGILCVEIDIKRRAEIMRRFGNAHAFRCLLDQRQFLIAQRILLAVLAAVMMLVLLMVLMVVVVIVTRHCRRCYSWSSVRRRRRRRAILLCYLRLRSRSNFGIQSDRRYAVGHIELDDDISADTLPRIIRSELEEKLNGRHRLKRVLNHIEIRHDAVRNADIIAIAVVAAAITAHCAETGQARLFVAEFVLISARRITSRSRPRTAAVSE